MSEPKTRRKKTKEITDSAEKEAEKALALLEGMEESDEGVLETLLDITPDPLLDHLDWENPDHKNYVLVVQDLARDMAIAAANMTANQRRVAQALAKELNYVKAAEQAGVTPQTVARHSREPIVNRYLRMHRQRTAMISAPTIADRLNMAWRIALKNEHLNPKVSLQAIDLLNKATNLYQTPDTESNQMPTIVLGNFTINNNGTVAPTNTDERKGDIIDVTPIEVVISGS